MRRLLCVVPALTVMVALGCGGGGTPTKSGGGSTATTPPPTGAPSGGDKTPVDGKGTATLKGTVTIEGSPTVADLTKQIMDQKDHPHCLKEDPANHNPSKARVWVVKDGKVANAVIFIRPPAGKYFNLSADDIKAAAGKGVTVDQPFCHFEPHVSVAFPQVYDPKTKKLANTDQVVKVANSAPMSHNTKWGGDELKNPGGNPTIEPKNEVKLELRADTARPIRLNCSIHQWMEGYVWPLDTPYAAVSKDDGTYEIKGIPAGAEVMVITWHEGGGWGEGGLSGQKMTLKEGDNTLDVKVKAK